MRTRSAPWAIWMNLGASGPTMTTLSRSACPCSEHGRWTPSGHSYRPAANCSTSPCLASSRASRRDRAPSSPPPAPPESPRTVHMRRLWVLAGLSGGEGDGDSRLPEPPLPADCPRTDWALPHRRPIGVGGVCGNRHVGPPPAGVGYAKGALSREKGLAVGVPSGSAGAVSARAAGHTGSKPPKPPSPGGGPGGVCGDGMRGGARGSVGWLTPCSWLAGRRGLPGRSRARRRGLSVGATGWRGLSDRALLLLGGRGQCRVGRELPRPVVGAETSNMRRRRREAEGDGGA
mmetsp:Transcript_145278/g.253520  ORF Transcript_145278/g.253520 Transcript_145278/m.253520 type:complete len:289 (+) Transcript_145278:528-1394(+)